MRYALLPDFQDVPLLEELRPHFDCPVFVEENIRALTLAEMLRGAGRGRRNFLCVAARSGIGMGIVIDGRIYTGNGGLAGKLGRTVFPRDGHPQTMTQLVSAKGIIGQAIELLKSTRKSPLRDRSWRKGTTCPWMTWSRPPNRATGRFALLEQVGRDLGLVVANLANLFAPEAIVLAGEVPTCCDLVRQRLEQGFRQHAMPEIQRETVLADGSLSGFAAAMGAAYQGFLSTFPQEEVIPAEAVNSLMVTHG